MDDPAMTHPLSSMSGMSGGSEAPAPCPAADTMRRVQAQLRRGAAPTFEALLAFGEPTVRRASA